MITFREAVEKIKFKETAAQRLAVYYGISTDYGLAHAEQARGLREALAVLATVYRGPETSVHNGVNEAFNALISGEPSNAQ